MLMTGVSGSFRRVESDEERRNSINMVDGVSYASWYIVPGAVLSIWITGSFEIPESNETVYSPCISKW